VNQNDIPFTDQTSQEEMITTLSNTDSKNNDSSSMLTETMEYQGKLKKQHYLGGGGEAKVYLVQLEDLEEIVVLKQYEHKNSRSDMQELYKKIKTEFKMLTALDHDNIIKYFCVYKPEERECENIFEFGVIMEYLPGGSLDSFLE
jgi:serine/threonine protein kinase